jgi:SAM-dependent methyltransferase
VAALVELLRPKGRILDIGCADGHLLRKLGGNYDRFGIELNRQAAEKCRADGITILASDILDPELPRRYAEAFELESAIAVFEHIPDFKAAVEAALALLRPDGILLFEVPLISETDPSDAWFSTSLEHIHYPTERSLQYLFHKVLGLGLAGSSVVIRNFARTYVGFTSKSPEVVRSTGKCFEHWMTAPPGSLQSEEARFRWLFEVIHAANNDSDVLPLSRYLDARDLNPLILQRLVELWMVDLKRCESVEERVGTLQDYLKEVEKARDWHAAESKKREEIIEAERGALDKAVHDDAATREALDRAVHELDVQRAAFAKTTNELEAQRAAFVKTTNELATQREALDQTIRDLEAERQARAETLRELVAERRVMEEIRAERFQTLQDLEAKRAAFDKTVCDLEAERLDRDRTLRELKVERGERERTVKVMEAWQAAIEASWSWRLTRPLRVLGRLLVPGLRPTRRE